MDWPISEFTASYEELRGSTNALVRVQVSDGFYCAADQSDAPFQCRTRRPANCLAEPTQNHFFRTDQNVTAEAVAVDREDGVLAGSQVEWWAGGATLLGTGTLLQAPAQPLSLEPRAHLRRARLGGGS
jgi:hypothetical protein